MDRTEWRAKVLKGTAAWKKVRITGRREARLRRKQPTQAAPTGLVCHICNRSCKQVYLNVIMASESLPAAIYPSRLC